MTKWFTSDTHCGHTNILFYTPERARLWANPDILELAEKYIKDHDREELKQGIADMSKSLAESVEKMTEGIISNWNSRVQQNDDVYHIGDFMMGRSTNWESSLKRLNGRIHLISGNHDYKFVKQPYVQERMIWIKKDYILSIKDPDVKRGKSQRIVLHHFPKLTWEGANKGAWHFHGHSHGSVDYMNQDSTRIDVGVDSEHGQYFPRSYEELKKVMQKREYKPVDHHNEDD